MPSSGRPPSLRQQLRLPRKPGHDEPLLQVLQRRPLEGTRTSQDQIHHRNRPLLLRNRNRNRNSSAACRRFRPSIAAFHLGGDRGRIIGIRVGSGGTGRFGSAEPVRGVPEAGRVDRVQVQVWDHVLRRPQVPGGARVRVRFQGGGERGNSTCESRDQSPEAREDLISAVGLEEKRVIWMMG